MDILDLLTWQPQVGEDRALKVLRRLRISENRRVGDLTDRQLGLLADAVDGWRRAAA